jgi:hypothetical protein
MFSRAALRPPALLLALLPLTAAASSFLVNFEAPDFIEGDLAGQPAAAPGVPVFTGTPGVWLVSTHQPRTGAQAITSSGQATGTVALDPVRPGFTPKLAYLHPDADRVHIAFDVAFNERVTGQGSASTFANLRVGAPGDAGMILGLSFRGNGAILLSANTNNVPLRPGGPREALGYTRVALVLDFADRSITASLDGDEIRTPLSFRNEPSRAPLSIHLNVQSLQPERFAGLRLDNLTFTILPRE